MAENDVLQMVCQYLRYRNRFFYRNNNIPVWDTQKKLYRRASKWTPRGLPDIIVVYLGQYIGLEIKGPYGVVSPEQQAIGDALWDAGARWYVVRDIEDVKKIGL